MTARSCSGYPGRERGLTLTELMITMGLVGILASAVLTVAQIQVSVHRDQNRAQMAQDNARAALEVLASQARLLGAPSRGYGVVNSTGSGPATLPIYHVVDNQGADLPDRLEVIVPQGTLLATAGAAVDMARQLDLLRLEPEAQNNPGTAPAATAMLHVGDLLLLSNLSAAAAPLPPAFLPSAASCAGGVGATLVRVTGVLSSASLGIEPLSTGGCSYPRGSLAVRAAATAYYIDASRQLVAEDGAQLGTGAAAPVAEGIVDMQLAVGVDGLNGVVDGVLTELGEAANDDEWAFNVLGEGMPVKPPSALRITVVARALGGDGMYGPGRPAVEDRPAGAPDGFRYRVLSTTVAPRNLLVTP